MKKRAMKKWIPKNSIYCEECKWWHYMGETKKHSNPPDSTFQFCGNKNCEYRDRCWTGGSTNCSMSIIKCDYLGIIDTDEDSLLWDGCKECGEKYESRKNKYER